MWYIPQHDHELSAYRNQTDGFDDNCKENSKREYQLFSLFLTVKHNPSLTDSRDSLVQFAKSKDWRRSIRYHSYSNYVQEQLQDELRDTGFTIERIVSVAQKVSSMAEAMKVPVVN